MSRDQCGYQMYVGILNNTIQSATISSKSACRVPVVVPSRVSNDYEMTFEQLSTADLMTYWITVAGNISSTISWTTQLTWN